MSDTWATASARPPYGSKPGRTDGGKGKWATTAYSLVAAFPPDAYSATCSNPRFQVAQHRSIKPIGALQSTAEQVRLILGFFGFSKSELAKIMTVSRPALYAWLDGESEPARENADRLSALAAIARDFDATLARPLFHAYIDRPVPGYSRSLLDILQDSPIDLGLLRPIVDQISRMTRDRERRIEGGRTVSVPSAPSRETQERNIEDNLSAIGPEG